jgi:hypothetical protein
MLKLARLRLDPRGDGSLNPRKEGPLIVVSLGGAGAWGGGSAGFAAVDVTGAGVVAVALVARCVAVSPTAGPAANNVAPHIPQKRLSVGLSLPQRVQRISLLNRIYSLRYSGASMHRDALAD